MRRTAKHTHPRAIGLYLALAGALVGALAAASGNEARADEARPPTVVELFTSQGCSSCPPADALLTELSRRDDIIALSFHVDYWDYIGWKDPFAFADSTERQHGYARSLRQRYVYTPEMVVDGIHGTAGSRDDEVKTLIARETSRERLRVPVTATMSKDGVVKVAIPAADFRGKAVVWLFEFDSRHTTAVERGENGGRTLTNTNVVRAIRRMGEWNGSALSLEVPIESGGERHDGCAVVVQADGFGPILGATVLRMP
jgi:hypothetical protein